MDMSTNWAARVIARIAELIGENQVRLTELDSSIGDGDLGLTMSKGFRAAEEEARKNPGTPPGRLFTLAGMAIARAAPSTMGTLIGSGFMAAGKAIGETAEPSGEALFQFFSSLTLAIQTRGKARPGEKTILDVLGPASAALAAHRQAGGREALVAAEKAAAEGLERTKAMVAQHGKAAVFREKSLGVPDPGGTVAYLIVTAFLEAAG